ncbi:MAG: UvrD-helicase domain-containing protein [Candidatus Ornithospirochaeta sp.]|nr:UvrD-helicase domain-containing protein [Candidatus Ornithospirochaeta sp.]
MIDLGSLNEMQREAVLDFEHNLLILACAGSGKTRTITAKIAYAISEGILKPWQILAVTFTNRAAREMKERVESLLPDTDLSGLEMRTFHSFGAYVLRRHAEEAMLSPSFCIYDDEDSLALLSTISDKDKKELREIQKKISKAKDLGLSPEEVSNTAFSQIPDFAGIYSRYEEALYKSGNADFADLILRTERLLRENDGVASYYRNRFRLILVDEYQDSNKMQFMLLKALSGERTQICVVGDDDQSIYSFRGAEIGNILSFASSFENVREIKLENNYRSTSQILAAAGDLIRKNKERHPKDIVSATGMQGSKPQILCSVTGRSEAERIAGLIRNIGDYDNTAVLYRTNAQSQVFEQVFIDRRIPSRIIGALRFYDREEVKDALAFLYLIVNPRDEVSFRRIINKPARGLGDKTVSRILSLSPDTREALRQFCDGGKNQGAKQFLDALDSAEKALDGNSPLGEILSQGLSDIGIIEYYEAEKDRSVRKAKLDNLGELVNVLTEAGTGRESLYVFLEKLALDSTMLGDKDPADKGGVTMMTMHNTKGLEFDRVFVVGLEENLIPGRNCEDSRSKEEERRILYVAMTRARKSLYLSFAQNRMIWGHTEYSQPSSFLYDIDRSLLSGEVAMLDTRSVSASSYIGSSISFKPRTSVSNTPSWAQGIARKSDPQPKRTGRSVRYSVGDRVRSPSYGEGTVENIEDRGEKRILTIGFKGRTAKFVEAFADLEKL